MIRLHIIAEGQAERQFVKKVLAPHLAAFHVMADARCVLTSRDKHHGKKYSGGLVSYRKAKRDIQDWIKEDDHTDCRFTTMFDLYALPNKFPGYDETKTCQGAYQKIALLEARLKENIGDARFIPYIQLHEFETLILADPTKLACEYMEHEQKIAHLMDTIRGMNPELINQGSRTAPSKRILREIPEYDKITAGTAIIKKIGLATLRERCRHVNEWLSTLERLNGVTP